jgi:hypothetical protein
MLERTDDSMPAGDRALGEDYENAREAAPEEIRVEIRETRERIGDNLEQLGERLNPENIKEKVKQDVRDATIGKVESMAQSAADQIGDARQTIDEARRTITDTVRENPIPAAMVGIGLGWLVYNTRQASRNRSRFGRAGSGRAPLGGYGRGYEGTAYGGAYTARGLYGEEASGESGTIGRVRDQTAEPTGKSASELANRPQDMAQNVAYEARHQARRVEDQFYENPLAVGAGALALGMAAGLAIPKTRTESELMGTARDRLADKTREVVDDTKQKVENVVERVADQAQSTAKTAAKEEGLTSS